MASSRKLPYYTDYCNITESSSNSKTVGVCLLYCSLGAGVVALFLQLLTWSTNEWLYTIEPGLEAPNEEGERNVVLFNYSLGYLKLCRQLQNSTLPTSDESTSTTDSWNSFYSESASEYCLWNSLLNDDSEPTQLFGKVSFGIFERTKISAAFHLGSLLLTKLACIVAVIGHYRQDYNTLASAILFIFSGIAMFLSVMQYICVVDDEMAPRLRQNVEGELPKYQYAYGWSFFLAAFSFLLIQIAALASLRLFLRRYHTIHDKTLMVPGLKAKLTAFASADLKSGNGSFLATALASPSATTDGRHSSSFEPFKMEYINSYAT